MILLFKKIQEYIFNYYDNNIAFSKLADFYYLFENIRKIKATNYTFTNFSSSDKIEKIRFLIATQSKGLLLYSNGEIMQLFNKKGFYGITRHNHVFFAFYKTGLHGNIISFKLQNNQAINVKVIITGLSRGVHQIDFIGNNLYVTNTYDNSILIYNNAYKKENIHWRDYNNIIYPNGKLHDGRKSNNYNHFNSIFQYREKLYLIAHNETKKTKRKSEVYTIETKNPTTLKKEIINGSNCHNIYIDDKTKIYCKSLEGIVSINEQDSISHEGIFTRGLSVTNTHIIIGGSEIQTNREKRKYTNGYIYIYNLKLQLIQTISISKTQIQEIKMIKNEKTFSNYTEE